jgi:uncharacterized coiled-coil DUF342 family protein
MASYSEEDPNTIIGDLRGDVSDLENERDQLRSDLEEMTTQRDNLRKAIDDAREAAHTLWYDLGNA